MRTLWSSAAALLAATFVASACGDTTPGGLGLKSNRSLGTPIACAGDAGACPMGTQCAVLDLADGPTQPICVSNSICEDLECKSGTCAVLESYPAQVRCVK